MSPEFSPSRLPAPCIIEQGILVNKDDIKRVLNDLGQVNYFCQLDGQCQGSGQGWILEVFSDLKQSTIVMNQSLYLNVNSFDYLQLSVNEQGQTLIDLWQDSRQLRLIPLDNDPFIPDPHQYFLSSDLESVVSHVLAAQLDVQQDQDSV
ncbi:MAG: hypothetical protein VKJ27_09465 [Synechocystis sp.]|jgi:hypothetical protein|nr:hypothetical protein [Synechocystis sp.]